VSVLSFVLDRHVETLITEPISMYFGFGSVIKVNLLNLFGIYRAELCRYLATQYASQRSRALLLLGSSSTIATALGPGREPSAGCRPTRRPDGPSQFGSGLGLFPLCSGSYALMGGEQHPVEFEYRAIRPRAVVVPQRADICQQLFG
jgi:hypothetical protein